VAEPRYWIGVASSEHVARGVAGGFCQLGHGKAAPLRKMACGDWIIYYSPQARLTDRAADREPCQQFTAIGRVLDDVVYPFEMAPGFVPFRRKVQFQRARALPIRPLLAQLSFIRDMRHWGAAFRFGHLQISRDDFELIAGKMVDVLPDTPGAIVSQHGEPVQYALM
jgi:hypothetical protein